MKKIILVLAAVIVTFTISSCKSKEEKAAELIKQELSHVLYDFESYEPIETVVAEAKHIPTNDSACVNKAFDVMVYYELAVESIADATSAIRMMSIWGSPMSYSSFYSNFNYISSYYRSKFVDALEKTNIYIKKYNSSIDELKVLMKKTNPSETIGYNVEHSFRCKTKDGAEWEIEHYRFIIDKKIKRIIFYSIDEEEDEKVTEFIKSVQNDTYEKIDTSNFKKYTR